MQLYWKVTLAKVFSSAYLKRTIFCVYLFYFASTYFCEWQVFEFLNFRAPKKKTAELRDIRLFLSVSTEERAGRDLYWFIIDLLLIDSKNLAELILCIFFCVFCEIWIFCIISVYLFSRMPFKRKSCMYLILRNRPKFGKNIYTRKLVHLR